MSVFVQIREIELFNVFKRSLVLENFCDEIRFVLQNTIFIFVYSAFIYKVQLNILKI